MQNTANKVMNKNDSLEEVIAEVYDPVDLASQGKDNGPRSNDVTNALSLAELQAVVNNGNEVHSNSNSNTTVTPNANQ